MTHYSVSVEPLEADTSGGSTNDRAAESDKWKVYYEVAKAEYDYAVANSSKLDSKAYTLLTVCAFLFTARDKGCWGYISIGILSACLLLAGIFLARAIFLLVNILNISQTLRVDVQKLLQTNIPMTMSYEETLRFFAGRYALHSQAGINQREAKYDNLARSIKFIYKALYVIIAVIVILLAGFVMQSVTPAKQVYPQYMCVQEERMNDVMGFSNSTSNNIEPFLGDVPVNIDDAIMNFARNCQPLPQSSDDAIRNSSYAVPVFENGEIFPSNN